MLLAQGVCMASGAPWMLCSSLHPSVLHGPSWQFSVLHCVPPHNTLQLVAVLLQSQPLLRLIVPILCCSMSPLARSLQVGPQRQQSGSR